MEPWKLFTLKLVAFLIVVTIGGYALLWVVELVQKAWKSNNWKKKWVAMSVVAGLCLILKGWFYDFRDPWKLLTLRFVSFALLTILGGFALLRFADSIEKAWKENSRRKKWVAMAGVVGVYFALKGWFQ